MTLHSDTLAVEGDFDGLLEGKMGVRSEEGSVKISPSLQSDTEASIAGPLLSAASCVFIVLSLDESKQQRQGERRRIAPYLMCSDLRGKRFAWTRMPNNVCLDAIE